MGILEEILFALQRLADTAERIADTLEVPEPAVRLKITPGTPERK